MSNIYINSPSHRGRSIEISVKFINLVFDFGKDCGITALHAVLVSGVVNFCLSWLYGEFSWTPVSSVLLLSLVLE